MDREKIGIRINLFAAAPLDRASRPTLAASAPSLDPRLTALADLQRQHRFPATGLPDTAAGHVGLKVLTQLPDTAA